MKANSSLKVIDRKNFKYELVDCLKFTIIFFIHTVIFTDAIGQSYSFKNFSTAANIPSPYVYVINQDDNGFLWVGTGNGLTKFDGINFYPVPYPDTISDRYAVSMLKDSSGRLWFGCNDGSLFYTTNGTLKKVEISGIQSINKIIQADENNIIIIPQEKYLIKININKPDEVIKYSIPDGFMMTCVALLDSANILVGTMQNILHCRLGKENLQIIKEIPGIEYTRVHCIEKIKEEQVFFIATEGEGLFILRSMGDSLVLERPSGKLLPDDLDIRFIMQGQDGSIWLATFNTGLFKIVVDLKTLNIENITVYNSGNGLQSNDVRTVFEDDAGNIWAGLYGEGLSLLLSQALLFYKPGNIPGQNNIIAVYQGEAFYLLGTPSGFFSFNPETGETGKFNNILKKTGGEISSYYLEDSTYILAGTKGNGLFLIDRHLNARQFFLSENSGQNYIRHIAASKDHLWLSTLDGILLLDRNTGKIIRRFNIEDRLPHNSINQVLILRNGKAMPATECDRLYMITPEEGVSIGDLVMSGFTHNKVLGFAESESGDIWAATLGNGLFWFTGDSINNITTANGLLSNFCYSVLDDNEGNVWTGHERGFSRFNKQTGTVRIYSSEILKNAICNPNVISKDSKGRIAIGTTEGLIIFDKAKEKSIKLIPKTNIVSVTINNIRYPIQKEYILPFGRYNIKIEYVGINLSNPESVFYSTKLDNWDSRWSEMKFDRQVTYQLGDGRYRFNVLSYSNDGSTDYKPATIDFYIKTPFWRTWWFIILTVISLSLIVTLILLQRERAREKAKRKLEEELVKRTSEVVKQKEQIELQKNEITDSINYARRIQASILPDIKRLNEVFKESFVTFFPRDIVSGDFYWFDKLDDSRFIIACADSTGHGVPGAFMSMIGSTLIQDIILRQGVTQPSRVLTMLDKQIISTLNQNIDIGVSNDGMDMVVCIINIPERHIRFASAMRPLIIIMGGELYYIKGNKYSVGGEAIMEKYFDDQEYYLGKGDCIYLFSDGYPDQFGGSEGKKMKIARFKSLIEEVNHLPMKEQKEKIEKFYFDWKGNNDQVDDVLVIGLRI